VKYKDLAVSYKNLATGSCLIFRKYKIWSSRITLPAKTLLLRGGKFLLQRCNWQSMF